MTVFAARLMLLGLSDSIQLERVKSINHAALNFQFPICVSFIIKIHINGFVKFQESSPKVFKIAITHALHPFFLSLWALCAWLDLTWLSSTASTVTGTLSKMTCIFKILAKTLVTYQAASRIYFIYVTKFLFHQSLCCTLTYTQQNSYSISYLLGTITTCDWTVPV